MGCAACLGDKKITQPTKVQKPINIIVFQKVLTTLKPSKIIPSSQFLQLITIIHEFCSTYQIKPILKIGSQQSSMQNTICISYEKLLVSKWKLIIFCQEFNIYQQKYNNFNQIIQHSCFKQIEKDLDRTFPQHAFFQSVEGIDIFKRVLKRISTYFPKVGYTQGVNFIVGYLLILGFTQNQSFWFTIHIALNKKYLLLGLFQDGFPLSSIYCRLFKYLFKKMIPKLFQRFTELAIPDQIWIFKWFMTYYLYSFPIEIVKQIWDFVLIVGGFGLVYFAVSLILLLENQLMKLQDDAEIANFFSSMKDIENFKTHINLADLINLSYTIQVSKFEISKEINQLKTGKIQNFYINYFSNFQEESRSQNILKLWHEGISNERQNFEKKQNQYLQIQAEQQKIYIKQEDETKIQQKKSQQYITSYKHIQIPNNIPRPNKKKQVKFRVKDQLKKKDSNYNLFTVNLEQIQSQLIKSKFSQNSINKQNQNHEEISEVIITETERAEQQNDKFNSSLHVRVNLKKQNGQHQQGDVQIFDLQQKRISFKKKKTEQNFVNFRNPKPKKVITKKNSEKIIKGQIDKKQNKCRQILHTIQNQDKSVIQFQQSDSNIIQNLSQKKSKFETPQNRIINQSNQGLSIGSVHEQSFEITSVK